MRSHLRDHKTGAVIFDNKGRILSTGCSHKGIRERWHHAEEHCLSRMWPANQALQAHCVVVTRTRGDGWAWSSRPCACCVNMLHEYGIEKVSYAERDNAGCWHINTHNLADIIDSALSCDINAKYASRMRVVV